MTRKEATIQALRNHIEVLEENIGALEQGVKMRDATPEERKSVDKYIDSINTTVQWPKYCDRNICTSNEYNGIGCDECEVTKSREYGKEKVLDKIRAEIETQEKWLAQAGYNAYNVDIAFNSIKLVLAESEVKK